MLLLPTDIASYDAPVAIIDMGFWRSFALGPVPIFLHDWAPNGYGVSPIAAMYMYPIPESPQVHATKKQHFSHRTPDSVRI